MLKIYINNEEVVANNDFTINKHMLNTPSVILNNVCPKEWKENKDYSSFYHPQDYSKCKIQDETYIPAEPGTYTTINGTATIQNVSASKLQEVLQLDGNTTQSGTPTPSSPQPINVVSGRQEVDIYNNTNLFNIQNNITNANIDSSGTITNGTYSLYYFEVNDTKKYRMTTGSSRQWVYSFYTEIPQINSTGYSRQVHSSLVEEFSIPQGYKYVAFRRIDGGGEVITNIQINEINAYEINLGKNLIPNNATTQEISGITFTVNEDKSITVNGTATANINYVINQHLTMELGTFTLSGCPAGGSYSTYYLRLALLGSYTFYADTGNGHTKTYSSFTVDNTNTTYGIYIANGTVCNNLVFKPQFEKGTKTSYSPYKTPIELCKIGDYKDRIYKDSGKWYIEKNIGKVVLNGTQTIYGINTNATNTTRVSYDNIVNGTSNDTNIFCNRFTGKIIWNIDEEGIYVHNKVIAFRINKTTGGTTVSNINNYLANNNVVLYYKLATPTYTEITDSELISQLEAVKLINGLNNVSISSPYLHAPIYIHYNFVNEETIIDLLFCGVVKNSGNISLNPREPHYTSLQILDFKDFLSSGETLDYVIYQKTIREAIEQVISSISDYGFILGNLNILNENEVIGAYSTKDKTAYDVFNYIADITQSRWTTRMIDENTVAIDFYDPTLMPQGTAINYTQTFFENNLIDDIKYNYGTNNYRNKQVMVSNQVVGNLAQIQTLYSNGYQEQYIVDLPIAQIESIYVNGVKKEVATATEKELGIQADFYYSINSNVIESEITYPTSSKIEINYIPIIEGRQVITNNSEIERINNSTGRKGIISRYESRNDATTLLELQKIGESYIKYKGTPEIVLKIEARSNIWDVGQRVQFNAPIDELDTEYMVRTKQINYIVSTNTIFYTYELVSSFNSETEINYFDNQRAKSKGNIGEGEYISRNIDIENVANVIFYNTTITEITPTGDNTLNSILNSPFTS